MDFDYNSSDILFPGDIETPKLTSSMNSKVPEGLDWAYEDFKHTFNDHSSQDLAKFMTLRQRVKVTDDDQDDEFNFGPAKTCVTSRDEKRVLSQLSPPIRPLDRDEMYEILKSVFKMVHDDITDPNKNTFDMPSSALSWRDEVWDEGNAIGPIDDFSGVGHKLNNNNSKDTVTTMGSSSFLSPSPVNVPVLGQVISEEEEEEEEQIVATSASVTQTTLSQTNIDKPLPALPAVVTPDTPKSNKGFKSTLSLITKPFKTEESATKSKPLKSFFKNTKKTVQKLFKKKKLQPKEEEK
jgi:hypothetical protein